MINGNMKGFLQFLRMLQLSIPLGFPNYIMKYASYLNIVAKYVTDIV